MKVVGRGTPVDRGRAQEWIRGRSAGNAVEGEILEGGSEGSGETGEDKDKEKAERPKLRVDVDIDGVGAGEETTHPMSLPGAADNNAGDGIRLPENAMTLPEAVLSHSSPYRPPTPMPLSLPQSPAMSMSLPTPMPMSSSMPLPTPTPMSLPTPIPLRTPMSMSLPLPQAPACSGGGSNVQMDNMTDMRVDSIAEMRMDMMAEMKSQQHLTGKPYLPEPQLAGKPYMPGQAVWDEFLACIEPSDTGSDQQQQQDQQRSFSPSCSSSSSSPLNSGQETIRPSPPLTDRKSVV